MENKLTPYKVLKFQFHIKKNKPSWSVSFLSVLLSFILFFIISSTSAQQPKIEELEKKLQITKDDKSKIEILTSLGELYLRTEPAKARKYCLTAFELSNKTNNTKGKINSCNTIGNSYYLEGDYNNSLDYYLKALKIVEEIGDKKGIANSLMGIGNIYTAQGNLKLSLEYQLKSLNIREELNDKDGISACYNNIGIIYMELKDYEKALDYQLKALKLKEEKADKKGTSSSLGNIGTIYYQLGNYPLALEYQQKAYEIRKELNNKKGMSISFIDIGNIYEKQEKYEEAVQSQLNAIKIAKEVGYKVGLEGAYLGLSSAYEKLNNTKVALEYYKLYKAIKDSIFNKENSSKLIEMQTKFDTERKEKEISLLTKGKEISNLKATQQELELGKQKMEAAQRIKEIELKEKELQVQIMDNAAKKKEIEIQDVEVTKQRMLRNSVTGGLLLACAFAFLLIIGIRQKQKTNKYLEQKNHEIAEASMVIEISRDQITEKNKNITDSINYAQRIQQAILPLKEDINKSLKDYFILYKPKDIVSGDFYFYAQQHNQIIVAVVDCTGHGVPGAFMSMIGNNILTHIIIEKGITRPAEILDQLNRGVKRALKQDSENAETTDGMDISLCTIDLVNKTMEYAGANRHLFHASGELNKISGDSASIGGTTNENYQFKNHELKLKQGDSIYIFTDGYVDQFGGEKGKKFMTKNLKNLLAGIHQKNMNEQYQILNNALMDWSKDEEQVDDILVVGIKF
jgi:serine phosphatase RsbU (regulator of sigma subunit)